MFTIEKLIIIEAVKKGADRQKMHEVLREISMEAWKQIRTSETNPMEKLLMGNKEIGKYLTKAEIKKLLDAKGHVGNATQKALTLAEKIRKILKT